MRILLHDSPAFTPLYFLLITPRPPRSTLFPYTTLFRSHPDRGRGQGRRTPFHLLLDRRGVRQSRARSGLRGRSDRAARSEEHTSELQSQSNLVCRLLLEKKKKTTNHILLSDPPSFTPQY